MDISVCFLFYLHKVTYKDRYRNIKVERCCIFFKNKPNTYYTESQLKVYFLLFVCFFLCLEFYFIFFTCLVLSLKKKKPLGKKVIRS